VTDWRGAEGIMRSVMARKEGLSMKMEKAAAILHGVMAVLGIVTRQLQSRGAIHQFWKLKPSLLHPALCS
jgi:hypothetical protein